VTLDDIRGCLDALIADMYAGTGDHTLHLRGILTAKRTKGLLKLFLSLDINAFPLPWNGLLVITSSMMP